MRRTTEFIGRKQLKKLTKANWKSFTQSKVSLMERGIDFQFKYFCKNYVQQIFFNTAHLSRIFVDLICQGC